MNPEPEATCFWNLQTPPGSGAIATIQLQGEIDSLLQALGIEGARTGTVTRRHLAGVDDGLVVRWTSTCCHLMPHAGPAVVRRLIAAIERAGARPLTGAPFFPEAQSPVEAAVLALLPYAASPLAVDLLLAQPRRWAGIADTARVRTPRDDQLRRLIHPPLVVAVGRPNIGKSSLLNALARQQVAVVADEPGTTRDAVGVRLEVMGLTIRYVDTPGIPVAVSPDALENASVAAARELIAQADLVLLCGDATAEPPEANLKATQSRLRVALRADRGLPTWPVDQAVSAHHATGLAELGGLIRETLVPEEALRSADPWRFWDDQAPSPRRG